MKSIANLASEGKAGKKRKRGDKGEFSTVLVVDESGELTLLSLPLRRGRLRQKRR